MLWFSCQSSRLLVIIGDVMNSGYPSIHELLLNRSNLPLNTCQALAEEILDWQGKDPNWIKWEFIEKKVTKEAMCKTDQELRVKKILRHHRKRNAVCVIDSNFLSHYSLHFCIINIQCNYNQSTGSLLEPFNNRCQQTLNALAQELAFDLFCWEEDNVWVVTEERRCC